MITIIASFTVKPECVEEFKALAGECVSASREESGNVSYHLYVDRTCSAKFFFVENWKDDEAIATHNASAHFQKFINAFGNLVSAAPEIKQVTEV